MTKPIALVAVALILYRGLPLEAEVTKLERQRLVAHLEMTAGWLLDEVSGLTAAQVEYRRAPDAWSIAQVVEHLVIVAPIYWQDLQTALKQPPSESSNWMTDADVLWYGIDRTRHEQAIASERPTGEIKDLHAALEAYRKHHSRLREYVATTTDDLRAHVVQRQRCDAYQWALMISTHEQRHILQIREIKADPKFPKH
jgi:uncharacterized damage-inducible protein DinB